MSPHARLRTTPRTRTWLLRLPANPVDRAPATHQCQTPVHSSFLVHNTQYRACYKTLAASLFLPYPHPSSSFLPPAPLNSQPLRRSVASTSSFFLHFVHDALHHCRLCSRACRRGLGPGPHRRKSEFPPPTKLSVLTPLSRRSKSARAASSSTPSSSTSPSRTRSSPSSSSPRTTPSPSRRSLRHANHLPEGSTRATPWESLGLELPLGT